MKKFQTSLSTLMLSFMMAFTMSAYSQNPTYSCVMQNDILLSPTVFQFDVYIFQTGSLDLYLSSYQLSFKITNTAVINGGTLTGLYVAGSSQLTGFLPGSVSIMQGSLIRVNGPFPSSNGLFIPAAGLKMGTFKISNTVDYTAKPDIIWWNTLPATTHIYAIVPPPPTGTYVEITNMSFHIPIPTSIPSENVLNEESGIDIYPNPSNDQVTIDFPAYSSNNKTSLEILSIEGKLIKSLLVRESKTQVNISGLPSGVYIIKVMDASGIAVKRMMKE